MCGIVGLYLKNKDLESQLGELFAPMLIGMSDRGPDSAGLAVYHDTVDQGQTKLTLQCLGKDFDWAEIGSALEARFQAKVNYRSNYISISIAKDRNGIKAWLLENYPAVNVMSEGQSIEIVKEVGRPESVVDRFDVRSMEGTHIIGHTRMATESAVTTAGSHPFTTGQDFCLVHNGSLSNHNRLRKHLSQHCGITFETENDSEVAAGYLTYQLQQGKTLHEALTSALDDLDGFYTFAIGTENGFAVLRDPVACKPAILAETGDWVAMASEYTSLADLPGIKDAKLWEPEPATVYTWGDV
ncbi:MAG: glutamine amidotransferase family protein [Kiritimatiellae bacterium]|nr:glutamine amidotransferase family protein [Kiritimatiellia bacterium]